MIHEQRMSSRFGEISEPHCRQKSWNIHCGNDDRKHNGPFREFITFHVFFMFLYIVIIESVIAKIFSDFLYLLQRDFVPHFRVPINTHTHTHTLCPGWQERHIGSSWRNETFNSHISFSLQDIIRYESISVVHNKYAKETFYDISHPVWMVLWFFWSFRTDNKSYLK